MPLGANNMQRSMKIPDRHDNYVGQHVQRPMNPSHLIDNVVPKGSRANGDQRSLHSHLGGTCGLGEKPV